MIAFVLATAQAQTSSPAPIPVAPVTVGPGTYWTIAGSIISVLSAALPLFLWVRKTAAQWVVDVANVTAHLTTPDGRPLGVVVQESAQRLAANTAKLDDVAHDLGELRARADSTERRFEDHVRDHEAHGRRRRF